MSKWRHGAGIVSDRGCCCTAPRVVNGWFRLWPTTNWQYSNVPPEKFLNNFAAPPAQPTTTEVGFPSVALLVVDKGVR